MMKSLKTGNGKAETGEAVLPREARDTTLSDLRFPISAFTLLELLVVMAIIAILAGLILSTAGGIQKKAARDRAAVEIKALEASLESYKADNGAYPETNASFLSYTGSNGSLLLFNALVISNATLNPLGKVYFEPKKGMLKDTNFNSTTNYFVDPFGSPYEYRAGTNATNNGSNFFDLWSTAGGMNSNSWIKNW